MRITVARLRLGIVVLGCVLVLILAGFLFYARFRFRRFEKDLPGKLGINIQQTANGFTYSQSSEGHTLYTIHASKLVQYKTGGRATLHDVDIKLYGPKGSNRTDRISGSEFDYDQETGIAVAKGTVQIDLAGLGTETPAEPKDDGSNNGADERTPGPANNTIHVKTSGLTFNSKTGDATTDQHMEFELPKAAGSSMGASYNSKTGLLILDHQVEITTSSNGKEATVHAIYAEFLRDSYQGSLLSPVVDYQSEKSSADHALLHFRKDGSVESIDSEGHVRVASDDGSIVTAQTSTTELDARSQPTREDVGGGVNFVSNKGTSSMHGTAIEGTLMLGPNSTLKHAQFRNAVSFVEQIFQLPNDSKGNASRQMQASKLDVDFVQGPDNKSVAHKLLATGSAQANLHTIPSHGPQQLTNISGDQLLATLDDNGQAIRQLDGTGNTKILDLAKDGSTNTSQGDRLHVTFSAPPANKPKTQTADQTEASQVDTAVQDGHVILTQTPVKKDNEPQPATLTAWATHSEYHSADQILHLTGNPRLDDGQSLQMTATTIDFDRDSGDAIEEGGVKATYTQKKGQNGASSGPDLGGQGPVHLTSARAQLHHNSGISIFYGVPSTPARLWQGQNSILAPVIELSQKPQTLKAYGVDSGAAPVVNSNLVSALGPKHQMGTVRIHSQTVFYSDEDRRGDFKGTVTAQDPDGTIHADQAQVFLTPAAHGKDQAQQQTAVDHMIATGHVVMTQPGRKDIGEKLVYTSDDGKYVLTGTAAAPPRMEDQVKGTTTGTALIFNSQDDSVEVSGGQSSAVTQTRTTK